MPQIPEPLRIRSFANFDSASDASSSAIAFCQSRRSSFPSTRDWAYSRTARFQRGIWIRDLILAMAPLSWPDSTRNLAQSPMRSCVNRTDGNSILTRSSRDISSRSWSSVCSTESTLTAPLSFSPSCSPSFRSSLSRSSLRFLLIQWSQIELIRSVSPMRFLGLQTSLDLRSFVEPSPAA